MAEMTDERLGQIERLTGYRETMAKTSRRHDDGVLLVACMESRELIAEVRRLQALIDAATAERARCVEIAQREAGRSSPGEAQDKLFGLSAMLASERTDEIVRQAYEKESRNAKG